MLFKYSDMLFHQGKYREAAERFEKAVHYAEKSDAEAATLANLALYHAEALKHYTAPLFLSVRLQKGMQGAPPQIAVLEKQLEGQYRQAIAGYQHAAELADKAGLDAGFKLQIQRGMGDMHHDAARFVKAVMARKKAIQQAESLKLEAKEMAALYHGLGESTKEMNQPGEAAESYRKSINMKEKAEADGVSLAKSWFSLGECLGASRKLEPALEAFTKARDLEEKAAATDENRKSRMKRYAGMVAQVLQALGKAEEAKAAQAKADAI
jgi:tetratricopeptide (TPR) repeat protein